MASFALGTASTAAHTTLAIQHEEGWGDAVVGYVSLATFGLGQAFASGARGTAGAAALGRAMQLEDNFGKVGALDGLATNMANESGFVTRLTGEAGALMATDRRGRSVRFPLDGGEDAPARFELLLNTDQYMMVDGLGQNLLITDVVYWDVDEKRELIDAAGIPQETRSVPPPAAPLRWYSARRRCLAKMGGLSRPRCSAHRHACRQPHHPGPARHPLLRLRIGLRPHRPAQRLLGTSASW